MALDKYDYSSDAIANLYRASLYLARESKDIGISFLLKAKKTLGKKMSLDIDKIAKGDIFKGPQDYYYWAEKILDEYKRLK
jgi:hypothetical protein